MTSQVTVMPYHGSRVMTSHLEPITEENTIVPTKKLVFFLIMALDFFEAGHVFGSEERVFAYLQEQSVIPRVLNCSKCNLPVNIISKEVRCPRRNCRKCISIFGDTVFSHCLIGIGKFLAIGYEWVRLG